MFFAGREPNLQFTCVARGCEREERSWILPVAKTQAISVRSATKEEDDTQNDQANDSDDLYASEPKLRFTVPAHDEDVEHDDRCKHDCEPHCDWNAIRPIAEMISDCLFRGSKVEYPMMTADAETSLATNIA